MGFIIHPSSRISNTNTYSCLRTVNATHNFLYCEFVSGLITYYDMNVDPYQLRNIYQTLSGHQLNHMHSLLLRSVCRGVSPIRPSGLLAGHPPLSQSPLREQRILFLLSLSALSGDT